MIGPIIGMTCAILGLCAMAYWTGRMDGRDVERKRMADHDRQVREESKAREDRARLARQKAIRDGHLTELWKVN